MTTPLVASSINNNIAAPNAGREKKVETPSYELVSKVAPMITEAEYAKIQATLSAQELPNKTRLIRKSAKNGAYSLALTLEGIVYILLGKRGRLVGQGKYKKVYECVRLKGGSATKRAEVRIKEEMEAAIREDALAKKFHTRHIVKASDDSVTYISRKHLGKAVRFMQPLMAKDGGNFIFEHHPFEKRLRVLEDAARGLRTMHKAGYLHRDVKPDNLFIDNKGCTKLADLGFAILQTETATPAGTPYYLPYKILASGQVVITERQTPKTDLYSLGITMIQIMGSHMTPEIVLLGRRLIDIRPFRRPELDEVIKTLRQIRKGVSTDGTEVIKAAK